MYHPCPHCHRLLCIQDEHCGSKGRCNKCGSTFKVPRPKWPPFLTKLADKITGGRAEEYRRNPYVAKTKHIAAVLKRIRVLCAKLRSERKRIESRLDQLWESHKTWEFHRQLAARKIDEIKEVDGVGTATIGKLRGFGIQTLEDLNARMSLVQQLPRVSSVAKNGIQSYVKRAVDSARSQPVNLSPDDENVRHLVELALDHEWLSGISMSADRARQQASVIAKEFPKVSFVRFVFGRQGMNLEGIGPALDAVDRIADTVRSIDINWKTDYDKISQSDYIRAIGLLRHRFSGAGTGGVRQGGNAFAPWEGGLSEDMARQIDSFTLDTSILRNCLLRRYQDFGAKFVLVRKHCFLGDEMGLGKTIQTLAAIAHLAANNDGVQALAIVPASLRENWRREIEEKTDLDAFVFQGWRVGHDLREWQEKGGIGIISYTTLRNKHLDVISQVKRLDFVVADEAQYIKNPNSGRAKATRWVLGQADYALVMTGTPIENHPTEFLAIVKGLRHGNAAVSKMAESGNPGDPSYFRHAVKDVYLRRNKEDVLNELPDLNENNESILLDTRDLKAHLAMMEAHAHFMHLRQHAIFGEGRESPKIKRVQALIEEYVENGRSVVVFTYFKRVISVLSARFPKAGVIQGGISTSERMAIIDRFSDSHSKGNVILAQVIAGGVGLNMQAASAVIIVEPQLNPATEYQVICRVHRMGQRNSVNVHRLTCLGTIEEAIVERLIQKRRYMNDYARESILKESSEAAISAREMNEIVEAQRQKLTTMLGAS